MKFFKRALISVMALCMAMTSFFSVACVTNDNPKPDDGTINGGNNQNPDNNEDTKPEEDDTKPGEDDTKPDNQERTFVLSTSIADGDEVIIYNAASGYAMSMLDLSAESTQYRAGELLNISGNSVSSSNENIIWTVKAIAGGYQFVSSQNKTLSCTGRTLQYGITDNVWRIEKYDNSSVVIVSTTLKGNQGDSAAMEWYSKFNEFTTYYYTSNSDMSAFAMQLYVCGSGATNPDDNTGGGAQDNLTLTQIVANMNNYTCTYSSEDFSEVYEYVNGAYRFTYQYESTYTEYFTYTNGLKTYYSDYDGLYYIIKEDCTYYDYFDASLYSGFERLALDGFVKRGDTYTMEGGNVNSVAKAFLVDSDEDDGSYTELFTGITINTSNGVINSIRLACTCTWEGEVYTDDVTLNYSKIGSTSSFNLPNGTFVNNNNYDEYFGEDVGGDVGGGESGGSNYDGDYKYSGDQVISDLKYNGMPSIGSPKALVIPVAFSDFSITQSDIDLIKKGMQGTAEETGYYSVNSYYKSSSFGKLNIQFEYAPTYTVNKSAKSFADEYDKFYSSFEVEGLDPIESIIDDFMAKNDSAYNYSDYDLDGDGLIDSVYLVYATPYFYNDNEYLWWAFTSISYSLEKCDKVMSGYYVWMSVDFFSEPLVESEYSSNGKEVNIAVNATTAIHETGHLLKLDDYYDYAEGGVVGGLGGGDMMDYNVGDHNAFTKTILGWMKPTEVTQTTTVTLSSITQKDSAIIIRRDSASTGYTCEYLIIDLYAPTDMNQKINGAYGFPSETAVRIYHVNATLGNYTDANGTPRYGFMYNNGNGAKKLIKLLEADGNDSIEKGEGTLAQNSDYYKVGQSMPTTYKWHDGTSFAFTIKVTAIDSKSNTATVEINFNN